MQILRKPKKSELGFKSGNVRAGSSARYECLTCTAKNGDFSWSSYGDWLSQNHAYRYTKELLRYSRQYADVLEYPELASNLRVLKRDKRRMAMASLANLSKYLGIYDHWKSIARNSGLKWERRTALETFVDIFESNIDDSKVWLEKVIQKLPRK